jgi:hypothetical protein
MRLLVVSQYIAGQRVWLVGTEHEVDQAEGEFLLRDSPGSFEVITEELPAVPVEDEPKSEGQDEKLNEQPDGEDQSKSLDGPPVDTMIHGPKLKK